MTCPVGQVSKTPPSHGGNRGSTPLRDTSKTPQDASPAVFLFSRRFRREKKKFPEREKNHICPACIRPDPAARSVSALSDLLYPACSRQERKRWIIAGPGGEHVEICGNGRRRKRSEYHKIERFFFLFFSTKCIKKIHKTGIIFQNISSLKPLNVVNILI